MASERLQLEVVGLLSEPSFHVAKCAAEALKHSFDADFEDPVLKPLLQFAWHEYLCTKKKEIKGEAWEFTSPVLCFANGQFIGDENALKMWANETWGYKDYRPVPLYKALAEDFYTKYLISTKHLLVYLDIAIQDKPIGRLLFEDARNKLAKVQETGVLIAVPDSKSIESRIGATRPIEHIHDVDGGRDDVLKCAGIELFSDICPKTCKNFQYLCSGESGDSQNGLKLHYKGSLFHRIVKNGWIQGGDIASGKGNGGESIFGNTFEDENYAVPHNKRGILGMANKGRHSNGSQFYITLQATPYMDTKLVAFGQLIEGSEVLQKMEDIPTYNERPKVDCTIVDCGIFTP